MFDREEPLTESGNMWHFTSDLSPCFFSSNINAVLFGSSVN